MRRGGWGRRHPIHRVDRRGVVTRIGILDLTARVISLEAPGFPLLAPGDHPIQGGLPWPLHDMAPDGFLAPAFARWFPELGLPGERARWREEDLLEAVTRRGHDLPGDLIIGEESLERYLGIFGPGRIPGPAPSEALAAVEALASAHQGLVGVGGPSLGGARPKLTLRLRDGAGLLVKIAPPEGTPSAQRWRDLLRMEGHCADALRAHAIPAVTTRWWEGRDQDYLVIDRFDRLPGGGRVGAWTLYYLCAERYGDVMMPAPDAAARLAEDGILSPVDAARVAQVHAWSAAVGNTDAHLGNYAILLDEAGGAALAPVYDVTAMALAPLPDGDLPDAAIAARRPAPRPQDPLLHAVAQRVLGDEGISSSFKGLWSHLTGV